MAIACVFHIESAPHYDCCTIEPAVTEEDSKYWQADAAFDMISYHEEDSIDTLFTES